MNARIHQGFAWIFAAAMAGGAGCSASDGSGQPSSGAPTDTGTPDNSKPDNGKPDNGKPDKGKPGTRKAPPSRRGPGREAKGDTAACFGPSTLATTAREQLVDQACSMGGRRRTTNGQSGGACASAYKVSSDAQIAGLLSSWNDAAIRDSTAAQQDADPAVRDLAHLIVMTHTRSKAEQDALFGRASIKPEETAGSRALGGTASAEQCLTEDLAECSGADQGPGQATRFGKSPGPGQRTNVGMRRGSRQGTNFGTRPGTEQGTSQGASSSRDYVARQIEAQNRSIDLLDALIPQAKNTELRCSLQASRAVAEAQLDHACWAWASITGRKNNIGIARSADESAGAADDADGSGDAVDVDEDSDTGDVGDLESSGEL